MQYDSVEFVVRKGGHLVASGPIFARLIFSCVKSTLAAIIPYEQKEHSEWSTEMS